MSTARARPVYQRIYSLSMTSTQENFSPNSESICRPCWSTSISLTWSMVPPIRCDTSTLIGFGRIRGVGRRGPYLRPRAKRPLSAYQTFVKEMLLTYNFPGDMDQKQKMREVSKLWAAEKESILDEEHYQAVDRENRIDARKKAREKGERKRLKGRNRKVPKKGADDDLMLGEGLRDLLKRNPSDADRRAALQAALADTSLGQPIRGTSVASSAVHMAKELLKNQ
eukprot:COSAG02_NODE_6151_length_3765_cov_4.774141_3_plen_225_part_00